MTGTTRWDNPARSVCVHASTTRDESNLIERSFRKADENNILLHVGGLGVNKPDAEQASVKDPFGV